MILFILFFIQYTYSFNTNLIRTTTHYQNNKIISITPGGYKGFYTLGVCDYIKQYYDLSDFLFSGASAGAWNALFLSFKGDNSHFINDILNIPLSDKNNIQNLQYSLKDILLDKYHSHDFDLDRLYIGVSRFNKYNFKPIIYNDFDSLEDAIDCCMASSHIPLITGGLTFKYRNKFTFDGGFAKNPFLFNNHSTLLVSPYIWESQLMYDTSEFKLVNKDKPDISKIKYLYDVGYDDTVSNKQKLDIKINNLKTI